MAILFYDSIDLSQQEIQDVSLEKISGNPAAGSTTTYQGRIYYDTSNETLTYYNGSDWISLDGTGNVDSVTATTGLKAASGSTAAAFIAQVDYTSGNNIINSAGTGGALATTSRILVDNSNTANYYPISDLATLIDSGVSSIITTDDGFINLTPTGTAASGDVIITASLINTYIADGKFLRGDKTWQLPDTNTNTTYTLPLTYSSNVGTLTLTDNGGTAISTASFSGTTNQIDITNGTTDQLTFELPSNVITPGSLTASGAVSVGTTLTVNSATTLNGALSVTGVATFGELPLIPTTTPSNASDAASKSYVDTVVSGGLIYQGGYNASAAPSTLH